MPYLEVQKRRDAYKRWWLKHREERREYQRILFRAKRANPVRKVCSIHGCDNLGEKHHPDYSKPTSIIWFCKKHHELVHHIAQCRICGGKILARGLCNKHYKSERKKIDPEYAMMEKFRREKSRQKILAPSTQSGT